MRHCIHDVEPAIVQIIRQLAASATQSNPNFGLRGVPDWLCQKVTREWEAPLTRTIETRLVESGWDVDQDKRYPEYSLERIRALHPKKSGAGNKYCDLKVKVAENAWMWIECKPIFGCIFSSECRARGDWSTSICKDDPRGADATIKFAAIDRDRLLTLDSETADYVGLLLLEFDRPSCRLAVRPAYQELLASLQNGGWACVGSSWPDDCSDRAVQGFEERCSLWMRQVC